ncbi:unnamed protein product [Diabrotica balteata]|uniref:Galectin domain-containing protein n=1 Tax=Diabrotica balteata TaxID=107213 RepID=A0A9N9T8W5_DIABA|nr:unnamed protein product [Diabrotica balteata]
MENPVVNPAIPFKGKIPGGLVPGRMCRIQGVSHPDSDRFNINFQVGPKPSDDTALHISVRHKQGYIARNSYINEEWGEESGDGELTIGQGESWEIIILVDQNEYKIAVNGQHFSEFKHRVPFSTVTDLQIDGDVSITLISWEGIMGLGAGEDIKKVSQTDTHSQWAPQGNYAPPQGGYGPPQGGYGPPQGYAPSGPGYGPPQGYGPPPPPGAQPESSLDSFLDGAQTFLSGAIKSGAAGALVGKFLGGGGDAQRGYSHNNAKYGIYPDLPQDMNLNVNQPPPQSQGPVQQLLAGLLSGGTQQPGSGPPGSHQAPGAQQGQVDYSALLTNLLSGHQESKVSQTQSVPGAQQSGPDFGSFLSGLLSSNNAPPPGRQAPQGPQSQGGSDFGTLLSGLLSNPNQQAGGQHPGGQGQPGSQNHGVDLSGLLSSLPNLLSGTATRPIQETGKPSPSPQPTAGSQQPDFGSMLSHLLSGGSQHPQGNPSQHGPGPAGYQSSGPQQSQGIDLGSLLSSLLSPPSVHPTYGGSQPPQTGPQLPYGNNQPPQGGTQPPYANNQPPQSGNQPPYSGNQPSNVGGNQYTGSTQANNEGPPPQSAGGAPYSGLQRSTSANKGAGHNHEDVSDQLEREMAREGVHRQYSGQENRQSGNEQYGYYPHPPEQQRGPLESLLSGFLSGGQQPAQQPPHVPQYGGESIGGLGSMGGILQNFAGQILHPRDGNQRQNY